MVESPLPCYNPKRVSDEIAHAATLRMAKQFVQTKRSHTMGDKGGKKDKDKTQKQKAAKQDEQAQKKQDKQPKKTP
jgi:hypothetical protein